MLREKIAEHFIFAKKLHKNFFGIYKEQILG